MKATELIEKLQKIVAENGDVEIKVHAPIDGNGIFGRFELNKKSCSNDWVIDETW